MSVSRFGVSLEEELLSALDRYVTENNFANRSLGHSVPNREESGGAEMEVRQSGCRRRCDGLQLSEIRNQNPIVRTSVSVPRCGNRTSAV